MSMSERKTIDLEQGWDFMQKGITKLKNILEGLPEPQFSSEDYMMLYTYSSLYSLLFFFFCFSLRSFSLSFFLLISIMHDVKRRVFFFFDFFVVTSHVLKLL